MEFADVARRRRMVRRYDPERGVPRETVTALLSLAVQAPSAGFSQGWGFLVLDSRVDLDLYWSLTAPSPGGDDRWLAGMRTAPVLLLALSDPAAYARRYAQADKGGSTLAVRAGSGAVEGGTTGTGSAGGLSEGGAAGGGTTDGATASGGRAYATAESRTAGAAAEAGTAEGGTAHRATADGGTAESGTAHGAAADGGTAGGGAAEPVSVPDWPVPWWDVDTGMAALLVLLGATDRGLGGCLAGVPADRWDAVRDTFGIPTRLRPVGIVTLGHPAVGADGGRGRPRRPLDEVVRFGHWDSRNG